MKQRNPTGVFQSKGKETLKKPIAEEDSPPREPRTEGLRRRRSFTAGLVGAIWRDLLNASRAMMSRLDHSIRAAVPLRRVKWWIDSRLAGKEYSTMARVKTLSEFQRRDSGSSKWRAWLALGCVAAFPLCLAFQWQKDKVYRSRIEAAVNREPGIEILGLKNYLFRKDRILLLRDPMAKSVVELLDSARIPATWREIDERGFISLEEPFFSFREREATRREEEARDHFRAEIAALYGEMEKLSAQTARKEDHASLIRSEFFRKYPIQKTADLVWIEGNRWELVGTAVDPYYSQIAAKGKDLIIGGGSVSLEKFGKDVPEELKRLREEISTLVITYREPELRITAEGLRTRSVIIEKLIQLLLVHDSYVMPPPKIELHATPVEGVSRGRDISLASARLRAESAAIRNSSVGPHVEITTFLDSIPSPGKKGVYLVVK